MGLNSSLCLMGVSLRLYKKYDGFVMDSTPVMRRRNRPCSYTQGLQSQMSWLCCFLNGGGTIKMRCNAFGASREMLIYGSRKWVLSLHKEDDSMNRMYRIIWSAVRHEYVVVSELTSRKGKEAASCRGSRKHAAVLAARRCLVCCHGCPVKLWPSRKAQQQK